MAKPMMIPGKPNLNPTTGVPNVLPPSPPDPELLVSKPKKVEKRELASGEVVARPDRAAVLPLHPGISITHAEHANRPVLDTPELGTDRPTPRRMLPIQVGRNPVNHAREIMWSVEEVHRITGKPIMMPYKAMEGISIHFSIFGPIMEMISMYKDLEGRYDLLLKERDDAMQAKKESESQLQASEKRVSEFARREKEAKKG